MPNHNQKLTLKPSHGMDMVDTTDTDTHTDTDTMVTILESDLLMLNQKLKPSHGMDMDIADIMDIPIDTDTVVTTGDRFLCHQYQPFTLNYLIWHTFFSKFQCDKIDLQLFNVQ